jgi:lipid-binding SYLF domain-containing protein
MKNFLLPFGWRSPPWTNAGAAFSFLSKPKVQYGCGQDSTNIFHRRDLRAGKSNNQNKILNTMKHIEHPKRIIALAFALGAILIITTPNARAASAAEMDQKSRAALQDLYAKSPAARRVGHSAVAVLVFPEILKTGFIVGAQHGDGTLLSHGRPIGYYKTVAASYGFQAGAQRFGYALFFMTNGDLAYLRKSGGWEIGTGPSVVIIDTGMAQSLTTTTLRKGVYAVAFGQKGLMAGLGLQGSKIREIHPA